MSNLFKEARSLFRRKKYSEVIHLLEPKVTLYRGSFKYFYYLGLSCLYMRDWGSAYSYLKTAHMIDDRDISTATAYGLVLMRRGDRQEGLEVLLEIVEKNELKGKRGYRKAVRALELVKKSGSGKDFIELLERSRFGRYFPVSPPNWMPFIYGTAVIAAFAALYLVFFPFRENVFGNKESRANLAAVVIDESDKISDYSESDFTYILSDREIRAGFTRAKRNLEDYRDNLARREINRLLLSNASIDIKQKAMALGRLIQRPDLKSLQDSFSYEEVSSDPQLYSRCHVKWPGRLSNLSISTSRISFDFLVGYHDRRIVEGIVPSVLEFEYLLDEAYAYEILGQVLVAKTAGGEETPGSLESPAKPDWSLKIISIRRIIP